MNFLTHLSLLNFRSHQDIELLFQQRITGIIGKNGAGKTNILDAIYHLCFCKSFLNTIDSQNINHLEAFYLIKGTFNIPDDTAHVTCSFTKNKGKIVKYDNIEYDKLVEHIGKFSCVIISPLDTNFINEGSEERRKFMDTTISQYNKTYLQHLIHYNHTLKQRNALLKQKLGTWGNLEPYNMQLKRYGTYIHQERKIMIEKFNLLFQTIYNQIATNAETVELTYKSPFVTETNWEDLWKQNHQKDVINQITTIGIHKEDLVGYLQSFPVKKYASQGQQKSFLIALKLAQYQWLSQFLHQKPILLLDDLFDKLDDTRTQNIMNLINLYNYPQVIITDTQKIRLENILQRTNIDYSILDL